MKSIRSFRNSTNFCFTAIEPPLCTMHGIRVSRTHRTQKFIRSPSLNTEMFAIPGRKMRKSEDSSRMYVPFAKLPNIVECHNFNLKFIAQTENCGRFWFQPTKNLDQIDEMYNELNNPNSDLESIENPIDVKIGQILAAVYPSSRPSKVEYYRAKVIFIQKNKISAPQFEVSVYNFQQNFLSCD